MNQVAEFAFIVVGAIIALVLMLRARGLDGRQRNAVVAATFGFFLCGRYAALIDGAPNWVFVISCAGIMGALAYNNLGFTKLSTPGSH